MPTVKIGGGGIMVWAISVFVLHVSVKSEVNAIAYKDILDKFMATVWRRPFPVPS